MEEKDYQDYIEEYKKLDKSTGSEVYWFSFDDEIAYLRERMKVIAANNQPADKKVSVAIKTMQLEMIYGMNYMLLQKVNIILKMCHRLLEHIMLLQQLKVKVEIFILVFVLRGQVVL